jgi:hypothetical protein
MSCTLMTRTHSECHESEGMVIPFVNFTTVHDLEIWPHNLTIWTIVSFWGRVRVSPLGTSATVWPLIPGPGDKWWWMWSSRSNENWQGKPKYSEKKPASVPLCPPQIPHDLTLARTRAATVGSRRLTAWAMARPIWTITNTSKNTSPFIGFLIFKFGREN